MSSPSHRSRFPARYRQTARSRLTAGVPALLIGAWLGSTPAAPALAQTGGKPTLDHAVEQTAEPPTIVVKTKPGQARYSSAPAPTIPVLVRFRGGCGKDNASYGEHRLELAGKKLKVDLIPGDGWRTFQFDLAPAPLQLWTGGKPLAENKPLPRASAVDMCNQALAKRQGAPHERMLREGLTLRVPSALTATFVLQCQRLSKETKAWYPLRSVAHGGVDVRVKCAPMAAADAPQPHKKTTTTGAPPRPGKPMPPPIEAVTLRAEVSQTQACPDSVRLVGGITARAASHGDYLFIGNFYLSKKASYDFDQAGRRSVVGVRKLDWGGVPNAPATIPGASRTLHGWVQLNVLPQGTGKVYSSQRVPFQARCKTAAPARIKAGAAAATAMTATAIAGSGGGTPQTSGQATGKRQHKPLRARSHVDATTAAPGEVAIAMADLATIDLLQLGNQRAAWGSNQMTLDDSAGGEAMNDGRCRFPYRFEVINHGNAPAKGFVTRLRVDDTVVAETSSGGMIGDARTVISGEAALAPGKQLLYVQIDDDQQVAERDENNNLRRIGVTVTCGSGS